jgi:hypothetical protein
LISGKTLHITFLNQDSIAKVINHQGTYFKDLSNKEAKIKNQKIYYSLALKFSSKAQDLLYQTIILNILQLCKEKNFFQNIKPTDVYLNTLKDNSFITKVLMNNLENLKKPNQTVFSANLHTK